MNKQVEDLVDSIVSRLYPVGSWKRNNLCIGPYHDASLVFSTTYRLNDIGYKASYYYSYTDHGFYIDVK